MKKKIKVNYDQKLETVPHGEYFTSPLKSEGALWFHWPKKKVMTILSRLWGSSLMRLDVTDSYLFPGLFLQQSIAK